MNNNEQPLKILNASAGSGKTYNLVNEYLYLLLKEEFNTNSFKNIIAMTFTNKAALEMKVRIIAALDILCHPEIESQKFVELSEKIAKRLIISNEALHRRAKKVLENLLHQYEDFFVMTIDKFNLKLIRSFTRDLDLPADFEIILNEKEVITQVVDKLLSRIGEKDLETLTQLVFEYAKDNIEDGQRWDFRNELIDFASILQKENYFGIIDGLLDKDFSKSTFTSLKLELKTIEDRFLNALNTVIETFDSLNFDGAELPGGSVTYNMLDKLRKIDQFPLKLFTDAFIQKCLKETPKGKRFPDEFKQQLLELQQFWTSLKSDYFVRSIFLKNFHNMALLQFLANKLSEVRKDEQLIRISEFNKLISTLVKNEDAPFIYERLGSRFKHFLLDEFQDTSHLQWLNMVPLIHESLGNNYQNLIVGDPKQSIYRFKNGVAEQFVQLPKIYNPSNDSTIAQKSTYFESRGFKKELDENWRSGTKIVDFNNQFFQNFKSILGSEFQKFYESIHQYPKAKFEGYVSIETEELEMVDSANEIQFILQCITEVEEANFKRGDICILGDRNKDCSFWANELSKLKIDVVSSDSLLVGTSDLVQLTLFYFYRRLKPNSDTEKKKFAEKLFRFKFNENFEKLNTYYKEIELSSGKKYKTFDDEQFLIDFFGSKENFFCAYENLYDLVQKFYQMMSFNELEDPYLHHFSDMANDFDLNRGPDLKAFIEHFESEGYRSSVQLPESERSVKIMSIHKSKGLEFPIVILPKMNFSNDIISTSKFLVEENGFILYSTLSSNSNVDAIVEMKEEESLQILTDNMNKCYVALTRPVERLYILNQFDKKGRGFGKMFHQNLIDLTESKEGKITFEMGVKSNPHEVKKNTNQFFTPKNITDQIWFPSIALQDAIALENYQLTEAQRFGNQIHELLALINTKEEISIYIEQGINDGSIELGFKDQLIEKLDLIFNYEPYNQLLENCVQVFNEYSIITEYGNILRPDKVIFDHDKVIILDFKSGLPKKKDQQQVTNYVNAFEQMQNKTVEGYLFYISNMEIVKVC